MEKIVVKVIVDGVESAPIEMGKGEESAVYSNDIVFYSMGRIYNKEKTKAPYEYNISIRKRKDVKN